MSETLKYCGTANLKPGDRVRHRQHPDLTGTVKCYEWNEPGILSGIPYNILWDDGARAADTLGWLFIYATDHSLDAIEEPPAQPDQPGEPAGKEQAG